MKKLLLPAFLLAAVTAGFAQTATDDYYGAAPKQKLLSKDRVSASIMAGTGLSFMSGSKTTAFTTFIAPKVNYQLSNKFRLNVGFMHYTATGNTAFFMSPNEGFINRGNRSMSGNLVMIGGDYLLNKRVTITGAVMTDVNSLSNKNNNYKAATIGMDYKVSEHSTIGFRATVSQGSSDYFYSPQRGNYQYNPFNGTANNFFSGFGEWSTSSLNGSFH